MSITFSFIGTGNMGGALARAASETLAPAEILLSNRTAAKAQALADELGCLTGTNNDAAAQGKYIFLGVKPQMMRDMLASIAPILKERSDRFILVSMAAGLTMENVVKTTVFLANMADFADMNSVYAEFFPGVCPARSAVAVKTLPKGALVEIECIAAR